MARFVMLSILVLLPLVFSEPEEKAEKTGRALGYQPVPQGVYTGNVGIGGLYSQQTGKEEHHDNKDIRLSANSNRGSSSSYSNTLGQVGVANSGYVPPPVPVNPYVSSPTPVPPYVPYNQYYTPYYPYYYYPYFYYGYPSSVTPVVGSNTNVNIPGGPLGASVGVSNGIVPLGRY